MEQHIKEPITRMSTEETIPEMTLELPNWVNFKCQKHPSFKVDALSLDEDDASDAKLLCLKCILEEGYFNSMSSKKIISIKDLIQKCCEGGQSNNRMSAKPNNGLEEQFLNFLTQDYIGTYERHLENQYRIIDQEIKGVIENLGKLREKYKDYYAEELVTLRVKADDIKKKIRRYLDENSSNENTTLSSVNQILQKFTSLQTTGELCGFLKDLYFKSKETSESKADTHDYSQTLKMLEDFKLKASNLDEKVAEPYHFQEMNKKINLMLKSEVLMFKKPANTTGATGVIPHISTLKPLDVGQMKMEYSYPSVSSLKINDYSSSLSDEIYLSPSPNEPLMMPKNKKMSRFCDIESQSLRNLKKEIEEKEKENSDPNQLPEITKTKLKDWINRRITGYLIFQNTLNYNPETSKEKSDCSGLGVHFNQMVGHKWKNLSRDEKEEYKNIAKECRERFRKDLNDADDLGDLFANFDAQIKKIKRESVV